MRGGKIQNKSNLIFFLKRDFIIDKYVSYIEREGNRGKEMGKFCWERENKGVVGLKRQGPRTGRGYQSNCGSGSRPPPPGPAPVEYAFSQSNLKKKKKKKKKTIFIFKQSKYKRDARIVKLFAEQTGLTYEEALDFFYNSKTFELISEGVADMHCLSDEYLAEELLLERSKQH